MVRILLVEDQPTLRQLVSEILEFSGYQVMAATDGRAALELLQSGDYVPDLILSDLLMEPLGGIDLLEAVRSIWWNKIPFIMMSGQDQLAAFKLELKHEVNGYIAKPFGIKDILTCVQQVLAKHQRNDSNHGSSENNQRFA